MFDAIPVEDECCHKFVYKNWCVSRESNPGPHVTMATTYSTTRPVCIQRYDGQGVAAYADGGKYVGQWTRGEKHGQGKCKYAGGNEYNGQWRDGVYDGQGTYT